MRVARAPADLAGAFEEARAEARASFGDDRLYVEKLVEHGRHVEAQVFADRHGGVVHLGERDCTVQRNHQKLIEESPATTVDRSELERTLETAVRATRAIGYVGAGTLEMLLDGAGTLRFMEMNTRLQVEHGVTEMRTGLDLVAEQIRVAAGHRLSFSQSDVRLEGHVVECRLNAEDPDAGFRPSPGRITRWELPPDDPDLRIDTHVEAGYEVPPYYDSLLCKVLARGRTRDEACDRAIGALEALVCEGVATTASLHLQVLRSDAFRSGDYDTSAVPGLRATAG
jgi:acetyl-CoA carboxylase biotin carboxylase subunit